ncbi:MAG: MSMEG_0567/Sll0786 family nitrogen starvation N-acetyltransferase [Deltaproteobacteria bacterium]
MQPHLHASAETDVRPRPAAHPVLTVAETPAELAAYHQLRREVFVEEQRLFEADDSDLRDHDAIPIIATVDGRVVGVVRCYRKWKGVWFGGRLAVSRDHRTGLLGASLVRRAVELMEARPDVRRFFATVQVQNVRFFERLDWLARGRPFPLAGCAHRLMEYPLRRARS